MLTIVESNMTFGPFPKENVLYIEKSELYTTIGENVKIAEFILKKDDSLIFIEAKSSSPKQLKKEDGSPSDYVVEISEKLRNSFELFISANLKIADDEKGEANTLIDITEMKNYKLKFRLVINGHKKEWLPNIQNAIEKNLQAQMNIWNIEVKVLNDEIAREYRLIS